jgi:hypothetical protein
MIKDNIRRLEKYNKNRRTDWHGQTDLYTYILFFGGNQRERVKEEKKKGINLFCHQIFFSL